MAKDNETKMKKKHKKDRHKSLSPERVKQKHRRRSGSDSPPSKIKRERHRSPDSPPKKMKREKDWSPQHYARAGYNHHGNQRIKDEPEHRRRRHHSGSEEEDFRNHHRRPIKQERENDDFRHQQRERHHNDDRRRQARKNREGNPFAESDNQSFGRGEPNSEEPPQDKDKPDFKLSGKLTEDTNTYKGVVIKYNQPPEARRPKKHWRLYPFKGDEALPVLHIHRSSAFLIGRERRIADIPVDHPSCSKQHAVLQFRLVEFQRPDGTTGRRVRPYIIDLNSANGTYVNSQQIDPQRYVELMEKDVIKFGFSSREYVLLHDKTDTSALDEDGGTSE